MSKLTELKKLSERNRKRVDELKDFRHTMATPRIIALEKNQMTLNENINLLEASYTNSMKLITASLERLLRRVRKLEAKIK